MNVLHGRQLPHSLCDRDADDAEQKPIGSAHSTLTQRRPILIFGTTPSCGGSQWLSLIRSSAGLSLVADGIMLERLRRRAHDAVGFRFSDTTESVAGLSSLGSALAVVVS